MDTTECHPTGSSINVEEAGRDVSPTVKLTRGQWVALASAVLIVATGMALGFWSSFLTLYDAARSQGWEYPARLPLSIDTGIVAYVVLDHLAVTMGARSRWLHIVAISMAAFTVWANGVFGHGTGVWLAVNMAMPALWVLGVEALRFLWHRLHTSPAELVDRIPVTRYLVAPMSTLRMRRRMWLANEKSYPRAAALEEARIHAGDVIRAATEKAPDLTVPGVLRRRVRTGRLPAKVVTAVDAARHGGDPGGWELEVEDWVTSLLVLPDRLAAELVTARRDITSHRQSTGPSTGAPGDSHAGSQNGSHTDRQTARQTAAQDRRQKAVKVRRLLTAKPDLPLTDVAAKCGVSESTVTRIKRDMPTPLRRPVPGDTPVGAARGSTR